MSILRLKNAGEELTLDVKSAEIEKGKFGEQVKFVDVNGDVLYAPLSSVVRQLDRVGVADVPEMAGRKVHISRAAGRDGIVFWNFDKGNGSDVVHSKTAVEKARDSYRDKPLPGEDWEPQETGGPPAGYESVTEFDGIVTKYGECMSEAIGFAQRIAKVGIPVDGSAVSAIAATLWISRKEARV